MSKQITKNGIEGQGAVDSSAGKHTQKAHSLENTKMPPKSNNLNSKGHGDIAGGNTNNLNPASHGNQKTRSM